MFGGTSEKWKSEKSVAIFPARLSPLSTLCPRNEAHATADASTGMKATAAARKVNMADDNSLRMGFTAPSYFIAPAR
jgi:hypothetical protein